MDPAEYDPNRDPNQRDPNRGGQYPNEKQDEKQGEKEQEKRQEKGQGLDEKYRRNPLGFVAWVLIIIWLGVTLLLQNTDVIADNDRGWAVFVWGAGVVFLTEALLRVAVPRWRHPVRGNFVLGAVLVGVGFGLYYDKWEVIGPIVIIAVGVAILVGRLMPRR
jgi:hypothetical protein